jgi:hypothetical protein
MSGGGCWLGSSGSSVDPNIPEYRRETPLSNADEFAHDCARRSVHVATLSERISLMHRNTRTAAPRVPSPRLTRNEPSHGRPRAVWHWIGLATLVGAIGACAAPPLPRDAADVTVEGELETNGLVPIEPRAERVSSGKQPMDAEGATAARLPWLSSSHIGVAVRAHSDDFQSCQALGDVLSQREDGRVTVGWAVRPNGSVHHVTLGPSTFRSDSINSCVLGVARQVTFPPSAAATEVSWTLQFRGASHEPMATATLR